MADENAQQDDNLVSTLLGISDTTGEIRNVQTDDDGNLMFASAVSLTATGIATETTLQAVLAAIGAGGGGVEDSRDTANEQASPLLAGETFTGTAWTKVSNLGHFQVLYAALTPITSVSILWSDDGVSQLPGAFGASAQTVRVVNGYNVVYYVGDNNNIAPYYKLQVVNGASDQGAFPLFISINWLNRDPYNGSFGFLTDALTNLSRALLTRSVQAGFAPDGTFENASVQGSDPTNSTSTPLAASGIYRGTWFPWQSRFVKLVTDLLSDVAGTFYIDFSEQIVPVDGDDSSVDGSVTVAYDPALIPGLIRRQTPIQSKWFRHRYVNGLAAQSVFLLDAGLMTSDPGIVTQDLRTLPIASTEAGIVRAIVGVSDGDEGYTEWPNTDGIPEVHLTGIDEAIEIVAPSIGRTSQKTVGANSPVRLDDPPLAGRVKVVISNMEQTVVSGSTVTLGTGAVYGHDSGLLQTNGADLPAMSGRGLPADENIQFWAMARGSGASNTQNLAGTTNAGTGTSTTSAKAADGVVASLTAAAQTIDIGGYSITPTLTTVQQVLVTILARKQAAAFQTIAVAEHKTGSAGNVGTVSTTASLAGGSLMTYLCSVSRESNSTVTGVTGLGLTWTMVDTAVNGTARAVDTWVAHGTATAGIVTASLSALSGNCHIAVTRFTGVDQTTPVQANANATANSSTPATSPIACTDKGMGYMAAALNNRTITAGASWTLQSSENSGGAPIDGLGVETRAIVATGTVTPTATASGGVNWAAVGVTLLPAVGVDPVVTLSYTLSGVPGATTQNFTLSSTTLSTMTLDVTGDRAWAFADVPNVHVILTAVTINGANAEVDQNGLRVNETSAPTCRISIDEYAIV